MRLTEEDKLRFTAGLMAAHWRGGQESNVGFDAKTDAIQQRF